MSISVCMNLIYMNTFKNFSNYILMDHALIYM